METLIALSLVLAAIPAAMFVLNIILFRRLPRSGAGVPSVSVLIPARNEESSIRAALESVLASSGVDLEVVVLDDHSEDRTAQIVRQIASTDTRVRLVSGPLLPDGWNGKQHACFVLSQHARHELLCFLDADVRLTPDALVRMSGFLQASGSDLVSGFPRQQTVTFLERLLIPQIHFVLLGYLPMLFMRLTRLPGFAAGCGQLMLARRDAYIRCGGHSAIRLTMHDGIRLPKAFREAGLKTDIFDATDVALCRMYRNAPEVWFGLAKNAVEGMAAPGRIPIFSILLLGGQVLPFVLMPFAGESLRDVGIAAALGVGQRLAGVIRFRQPFGSALLHPVGVIVLLSLQWYALIRHLRRRPASWKGRAYAPAGS